MLRQSSGWPKRKKRPIFRKEKKILLEAQAACPGCFPIEWELLFIGRGNKLRSRGVDFSLVKSYLLEIWLTPEEFSEERRRADRLELFEDPQLLRCLAMSENPASAMEEYLFRLSGEFITYFIEGDNRITRPLFGLRLDRNPKKTVSEAAAKVLRNIRADEDLPEDRKNQLFRVFYQALSRHLGGQTSWVDAAL